MTDDNNASCLRCVQLEEALLRSEQQAFDRLRELADKCKTLQEQVVSALAQQTELSHLLVSRTTEAQQTSREREALAALRQEALGRLRALQASLAEPEA